MPHQQQRIFGPRLGPAEVPQQQRIQVVLCFVNQHKVLYKALVYFYFLAFSFVFLSFQPLIAPLLYGQITAIAAQNMTIRYVIIKRTIAG